MIRRLLALAPALAVVAGLVLLPACGKKPSAPAPAPGGDPAPAPAPGGPTGATAEFVAFVHVNGKDVTGGELYAEVSKAFGTGGGPTMLSEAETQAQATIGVRPTDIASLSLFVTEVPERGEPKFVGILVANKAIDKAAVLKSLGMAGARPDARGVYAPKGPPAVLHFADEKTVAMVNPDLADQYLAGYAKDRTGWPVNADLTSAAAGHTVYARLDVDKLRPTMRLGRDMDQFAPLLAAKAASLTLDLKGKTLAVGVRGSFPDADAAGKAKELVTPFVGLAGLMVDGAAKDSAGQGAMQPAVKAAQKTMKEAKVDVSGTDLVMSASYTADFDFAALAVEAAKKVQVSAGRVAAQNNLKQVGLALLNFHDANNALLVHAVGANGQPLRKPADKPLLSWRVAILPYIEQEQLYRQFKLDEPWDSEANKKLIDKMPKVFAPPAGKPAKTGHTHLQMVVGPAAMQPTGGTLFTAIPDGTSNTVAVVEAAEPVVWTKPADLALPGNGLPKDFRRKFGGLEPGGFNVVMWDASVRFVRDAVSDRTLAAALGPKDGLVLGGDW